MLKRKILMVFFSFSVFVFACESLLTSAENRERENFRDSLDCCACLATQEQLLPHPDLVCPQLNMSVDNSDYLLHKSPCLCNELEKSEDERKIFCSEQLAVGASIRIIGRCLEAGGICENACLGQTFVFPLEEIN